MTTRMKFLAGALGVAVALGVGVARAQQGDAVDTVVLDTLSVWRMHCELAPPVLGSGEKSEFSCAWMGYETPPPAEGWQTRDFDDRFWYRGPLTLVPRTALLSRACVRGKFSVTNPSAVKGLRLSASYHGGIIVYVNGDEVHREHIAKGKSIADGVAGLTWKQAEVAIPESSLREGMNVVALEVVHGAYPTQGAESGEDVYNVNTCEVGPVRLLAAGASGLQPNIGRPSGLQVWPSDPMAVDTSLDSGDRSEPLQPVTIIGARNGRFSGKVVVGSSGVIRGIKATAGDLQGEGGLIPAAAVSIRYGIEWGEQRVREMTRFNYLLPYIRHEAVQYNALSPEPPGEVTVPPLATAWYRETDLPEAVTPVPGAVLPVWITVNVPPDVKAGTYAGTVRIEAAGEKAVAVPVEVRVADWTLPDTQEFRTWVDMIQCPDTLAMEYGVPLWSEKHWEMIAQSFRLIGQTGSRIVYVPLIAHTNLGNEQSMVRWVKKGAKYEYDFSTMEKYLDVAEQNMGTPKLLVFVVWDVYMLPLSADENPHGNAFRIHSHLEHMRKIGGAYGNGPIVTVVDAQAGTTENMILPAHLDSKVSRPLWEPLLDEIKVRLKKRGMDKIATLGLLHDTWATKEEVQLFQDMTGGIPWAMQSHGGPAEGQLLYGITPIAYQAVVWDVTFTDDGADGHGKGKGRTSSLHGWTREVLWSQFDRFTRDHHPCTRWRHQAEVCITGLQRGPGRLGADYWKVMRDKKGKRVGRSYERYPESSWRNLVIPEAILAPGPTGPVATTHLEALREGVQECEARIVIEQALMDKKLTARLGAELTRRCQEFLHARHMMMWLSLSNLQFYYSKPGGRAWETTSMAKEWRTAANVTGHNWFLSSGYQERTAELFALAGEVSKKLNRK